VKSTANFTNPANAWEGWQKDFGQKILVKANADGVWQENFGQEN